MVAEGGGVATHPGHELQFATGFAGRRGESGPHAVVTGVEDQHRALVFARLLPIRDQRGQSPIRRPESVSLLSENGV